MKLFVGFVPPNAASPKQHRPRPQRGQALDALPLLHALGVVADDNDSHKTGASTETVALTGSLDQVLACVDEAREARAAAFNDELSSELKTLGLPELTQSLLSISPEEDDGKCAFLSASQLYRTGTGTQAKNGRAWDETTQATKKHGRRS